MPSLISSDSAGDPAFYHESNKFISRRVILQLLLSHLGDFKNFNCFLVLLFGLDIIPANITSPPSLLTSSPEP